jgi:hypothetical protein
MTLCFYVGSANIVIGMKQGSEKWKNGELEEWSSGVME